MNKLGCLSIVSLLTFSAPAMETTNTVNKLDTTSPVNYTLPRAQSLKEACIQKCLDIIVSEGERSNKLLKSLESPGMEALSEIVKAALINDYLVVLGELFKNQLPRAELDYYKKREPQEGLSEVDCAYEGVITGALTSDAEGYEGIVFLSFRKEGQEYGTYLDYWFFGDLRNDELKEKKPRSQCKIPIRYTGKAKDFSLTVEMFSESYTNRFFFYDHCTGECQLWRLGKAGFEHELSFAFYPSYIRLSSDGTKLCMRGSTKSTPRKYLLLFEDIETLKNPAVENILKKNQLENFHISGDNYSYKNPLVELCTSYSDWDSAGNIALLNGWPSNRIELRNIDDISTIKAGFSLKKEKLEKSFTKLRILANGKYILATKRENVWLIDTTTKRAELIASNEDNYGSFWRSVKYGDGLSMSTDERFAILTWHDRYPILYDLKRKISIEIRVGSEQEIRISGRYLRSFNSEHSRSTYVTSHNDMLLFIIDRRVRFVCLKSVLEAKSLRILVGLIRIRNAIAQMGN
jgi:hypothetical protein